MKAKDRIDDALSVGSGVKNGALIFFFERLHPDLDEKARPGMVHVSGDAPDLRGAFDACGR